MAHNERLKLTANYLNTAAGTCFAAGVVAPFAPLTFGFSGGGSVSTLTFGLGVATFLTASGALHLATRSILKDLRP
ncbi:hypothetical protein [Enterovirga aerilata]|uniref:Amino acid transporter n=1 Tax=Enterovirga aerilata TaxID=2730920 RepID=A0A849I3D8_9HYPH|nr:hypothetical protein [Enterovirga sp. DB1703]NNM72154.1 hypothetical protein [Enterovirga sp. DB1703]